MTSRRLTLPWFALVILAAGALATLDRHSATSAPAAETTAAETPAAETPAASPRLSVLFLGDQGPHRPAERARQLIPILADRGIDVAYTERRTDLNAATLARYDAVIIYANIDRIEPAQETALLQYVEQGGGFVPLHCASFCFHNSPRYIDLVGAQFQTHGTGEFNTQTIAPDHPLMRGLAPFRTWDETYVHHRHNDKDRTVLQVRREADRAEPWTWVRSQGKGRVFYTAYGHDARTWGEPGFHALVERGIRWAANKGQVVDGSSRRPAAAQPFQFAKAILPNYVPSNRWGTQGEPLSQMQLPLSPAESVKHMVLPAGFEPQLFAAEPDIGKPLCLAWDHRGRLWIAETVDYPNELQTPGQGRDQIKICEDTDGDGLADKFTVFADKLSIPTSIAHVRGGLIVHQAPDTLFLKDTDGDDQADVRTVLFSGWNTNDTHAGPSNVRYGFDNWLYGMVGYAGFQGTVGGESHNFRTGFFRLRPDGSKIEFLRNTNNNSWGVGLSEEGFLFGSTANGCPSVYLPIPNRYYEAVRGWSPTVLANIAPWNRYYPITDKVRQVDWHGGFTAAAGHALYTARAYPRHYWNRAAFVAEPTGHLAATFLLEPRGSDFVSHNSWNLLASFDEWTAPIAAEVGPDGHVWMIDWYNYIVQHNPTPQGFKTGKGAAYETDLRDKTHGRVYRLVYKSAPPSKIQSLDPAEPRQLLTALASDNLFWRLTAQRLLVERGDRDIVPDLVRLVREAPADDLNLRPAAIHALWTLHGLGAFDGQPSPAAEAQRLALKDPSSAVRRAALLTLPRDPASLESLLSAASLRDADAQVRLAALLTLAEMPTTDQAGAALADLVGDPALWQDRWLPDALTAAAARHDLPFLAAIASRPAIPLPPPQSKLLSRVAEHFSRAAPVDRVASLLISLEQAPTPVADLLVAGLSAGWPKDRPAKLDDRAERALAALAVKVSAPLKGPLVKLADRLGAASLEKYAAEIVASLSATLTDESQSEAARAAAARQWVEFRKTADDPPAAILELLSPRTSAEFAAELIDAVAASESPSVGPALVNSLASLTPSVRPRVLRALLSRNDWIADFLTAVEQGKIRLAELSLDQKQSLATHPKADLAARAKKLLAQGGGLPDPDRQRVIDELAPQVLRGGSAVAGKLVFKEQCAKCHVHSGEGTKIGPDLTGMAVHPKEELLIHLLDPSRSVEGNYVQYSVVTDDGRPLNGLLSAESKTSIELLDAEGKRHALQRENIEQLTATKKSLMPEGFEKQVPVAALADLLEFLTQRGKFLPLDLTKVASAISTRGMFYDEDSQVERLVFSDWSTKTVSGVPFQLVDPQGDRVKNVLLFYGPEGSLPPKMPKSVTLPVNAPAKAFHLLSGVSGWGYAGGDPDKSVSLIVRLRYADGAVEDHPLKNGVHFADYIRAIDVPESKLAFRLRGQQIRYLSIQPNRSEKIQTLELVKGPDSTAPIVMAITLEAHD